MIVSYLLEIPNSGLVWPGQSRVDTRAMNIGHIRSAWALGGSCAIFSFAQTLADMYYAEDHRHSRKLKGAHELWLKVLVSVPG